MPGISNGTFPLPRPLAHWRSVAGSAASGAITRATEAVCLSVHPSDLPVRQAGAVRGNRARIKLRCTRRGSSLSVINFIKRHHHCLYDSRLASLVSVSALLKAVRQGARCAVPQIMKALPGIGRSAVTPYETTARGLPCPDGHNNGVPDAAQYRPATHHVQTTSSIAPVSPPEQKYTQPAQAKPPEKYSPSARKP